jgi:hypothetical protein
MLPPIVRRWVGAMGLGVAVAAIGAVFACRQTIGIDQYFNANATTTVCGLPYGTTACASCVSANCCAESSACASSPVCNAYEACLAACPQGDPACRARCGIDHATGTTSEVSTLSACLVTHCENDCGLSCGALAGWAVEPAAAAGFRTCMDAHCGAVRACAGSAACDAVTRCFVACAAQDCVDTCMASHGVDPAWFYSPPDAGATTATFAAFDQARATCASAAGSYWECVGHVSWNPAQALTTTLQAAVVDSVGIAALPGMDVQACNFQDPDCTTPGPLDMNLTNTLGQVSLKFAHLAIGINGYLKITSGATVPEYFYWGFPLSQSQFVAGQVSSGSARGIAVTTVAEFQSLSQQIAANLDAGLGDTPLGVYAVDCMHMPAAGVKVTLSPADTQTIAIQGPSLAPGDPITDSRGSLLFVNVPAGLLTVTATPMVLGRASGTVSARVRAGTTTTVVVGPTP